MSRRIIIILAFSLIVILTISLVVMGCTSAAKHSLVVDAAGKSPMIIEPSATGYDDVKAILDASPDIERNGNLYNVSIQTYEDIYALFPPSSEEELRELARWREQFEVHWPNVNAFNDSIKTINADRIISKEESLHMCFALEQWEGQMTAARDYVKEYREVDPETVEKNPGLGRLESEAERALTLLNEIQCE